MSKIVVLFAHGRTGTHMLRSILSQETWIRNHDEPFNPAIEHWNKHSFFPHLRQHLAGTGAMNVVAAKQVVDAYFDHLEHSLGASSGLVDLKVGQIGAMDWPPFLQGTVPVILDRVMARGWPIVLCRRRDQLAAYVSQKRAEQSGVWVRREGKAADDTEGAALHIDPAQLLRFLAQQERVTADVDRWISGYPSTALIHYEDFGPFPFLPDPVREIFSAAFARPLRRGVKTDTVKLIADHHALIVNADEVRNALLQQGYAQFWPETAPDLPRVDGTADDAGRGAIPAAGSATIVTAAQAKDRAATLKADIAATLKTGVTYKAERHALADVAVQVGHFDDSFVHRAKNAPFAQYHLEGVASFARLMFQARRRDYLDDRPKYRWLIDDKLIGLRFAESLGIPVVPYLFCDAVADVPATLARMGYPAVVKPLGDANAANVFMIFEPGRVVEHQTRQTMNETAALARMAQTGQSKWLVQRYIGPLEFGEQPVTEIKSYMFYGEVGVINEVTTYPEIALCEWSPDGREIDSGRPINRMKGRGFTPELVSDGVRMSLALPAPFLRVDFLFWQGQHYFNEVSPQPGSAAEQPNFDRALGDLYLAAEARLLDDLFEGKPFPEIRALAKAVAGEMT